MKRFGGFDFLQTPTATSFDLLNLTLINQLVNLVNQSNQSLSMVNADKIASLFRIYPAQASVSVRPVSAQIELLSLSLRSGITIRAGHQV